MVLLENAYRTFAYVLRGVWDMPRKAQQRWGAAWFNGQSQRRCCSQFPADAGRRCQEVWRLLAGVWNSPGSLPNHNCYCFGFRDDVKNTIWDECLGVFTLRGWKLVILVPYGLLWRFPSSTHSLPKKYVVIRYCSNTCWFVYISIHIVLESHDDDIYFTSVLTLRV